MTIDLDHTSDSLLSDVDGVTADLVGGFRKWMNEYFGFDFDPKEVVYHNNMGRSPKLHDLNEELRRWFPGDEDGDDVGFGGAFTCFMRDPNVYMNWVDPIPGSVDAVAEIREEYNVVFVTALMKRARNHFRSKMEWIERWFPNIPVITAPSGEKWRVGGTYAVDDRYDTVQRWRKAGVQALMYGQSWSEAPDNWPGHDWKSIKGILLRDK